MTPREQAARAAAKSYVAAQSPAEQARARDGLWAAVGGRTALGQPVYWLPQGGMDRTTCDPDRAARLWAALTEEMA